MKRLLGGGYDQSALDSYYGEESITVPHQSRLYSSTLLVVLGLLLAFVVGYGLKLLYDRRSCDCLEEEAKEITDSFEMATTEEHLGTKIDKPEGTPGYRPPVSVLV